MREIESSGDGLRLGWLLMYSIMSRGQSSKKNAHHTKIGRAIAIVTQSVLTRNQLPAIIAVPVSRIDQG